MNKIELLTVLQSKIRNIYKILDVLNLSGETKISAKTFIANVFQQAQNQNSKFNISPEGWSITFHDYRDDEDCTSKTYHIGYSDYEDLCIYFTESDSGLRVGSFMIIIYSDSFSINYNGKNGQRIEIYK